MVCELQMPHTKDDADGKLRVMSDAMHATDRGLVHANDRDHGLAMDVDDAIRPSPKRTMDHSPKTNHTKDRN